MVNFLGGSIRTDASGTTTVATRLGPLTVRSANGRFDPGDRVHVVVRPVAIRLGPHGDAVGPYRLPGTIESAVYTGALIRYTVNVAGARLALDLSDPRHTPAFDVGDRVTVILPDDPHLLPETEHA